MKIVYCSKHHAASAPDGVDTVDRAAMREFGSSLVSYPITRETETAPYPSQEYEVIGHVAAHRSGPVCNVLRRRA